MKTFVVAALAVTVLAVPAFAEEDAVLLDYAETENWSISIDPSLNNG
ncbi:MAG: hypothetical protein RLZZ563_1692, partial [Pseudomonadota bacterium]